MTPQNRFALTLETLTGQGPEIGATQPGPDSSLPRLSEVLDKFAPLPREALFLGLAADGLPVLLNLLDPLPGPLLIVGDATSGKTRLLQAIARVVERAHSPRDIRLAVVSMRPDQWTNLEGSAHCDWVAAPGDASTAGKLSGLVEQAHQKQKSSRITLLLIDDLDAISRMSPVAHQNLRWLFLRGPARRVWPIVSLDSRHAGRLSQWLEAFRTKLFGHIAEVETARVLTGRPDVSFNALTAGAQFAMREGSGWLNFWVPALD
jgi:hypothetical protein